jgi:hypothetical protein
LTQQEFDQLTGGAQIPVVPSAVFRLKDAGAEQAGGPIFLSDTGDAPAGAPDTSSTVLLLGLGLLGMGLLARSRALARATQAAPSSERLFRKVHRSIYRFNQ